MGDRNRRPFWMALGITLFLLILVCGLVMVDYEGRKMSFGDNQPPLQVIHLPGDRAQLSVKTLGWEGSWDITTLDRAFDFICDFCCLPHA